LAEINGFVQMSFGRNEWICTDEFWQKGMDFCADAKGEKAQVQDAQLADLEAEIAAVEAGIDTVCNLLTSL
jgi:hypothetical protein